MAADIEHIFQDFILNKIREIEDQNEDKAGTEGGPGAGEEPQPCPAPETETGAGEQQDGGPRGGSQKKHKKHKKHKSKKKKRSQEHESSPEATAQLDHSRRGRITEAREEQGEQSVSVSRSHRHSSGKKKKKKKRRKRKGEEDSSCSDSESKHRDRSLPRRRQELPDIIPKQDSSNKVSAAEGLRSGSHWGSVSRSSPTHCPSSPLRTTASSCVGPTTKQPTSPHHHQQAPSHTLQGKAEDSTPTAAAGAGVSQSQPGPLKAAAEHSTGRAADKRSRRGSRSPHRRTEAKKRQRRSRSPCRSHRSPSRSRSPSRKRRSRSRSGGRRSRKSRSRSMSRDRRRATYSQRDRWKREPSHSPVLILRKNRSPNRKHPSTSPQRVSELDKEQLLEIAKANAAAMCAKAGMPIPASLRSSMLPMSLPSMAMNAAMASMTAATMTAALSNLGSLSALPPLPSITNKPPPLPSPASMCALEEVKRKVAKQANSISIKEFTDKCKMIVDSKGELPVAAPHVSDEEDDGKPFGGAAIREQKAISFSINNPTVRPGVRSDAGMAKEFPVSSGCQHRKKEGDGVLGAYGEWVVVDKTTEKAAGAPKNPPSGAAIATGSSSKGEVDPAVGSAEVAEQQASGAHNDSVFPDPVLQPVDISQAVTERIKAQRRLAENPYDVSAICMLSRAQEQVDAWAQSSTVPGLFTGSTGAQVLTSEELSNSGPQAWLKKDQFLRAAPVSGGVGEFLMRKMGWRTGEGLGRNREGTVEPIIIDFKVDRKGLVAEGEKPQKQTGGLVVTKDLMGKHPVSALIELCNKKRIMQPDFVMVHHSGPDHRKNFLFKVTVNGVDYQPQTASPNKKHAKAMAATVALQAMGEVPVDGPGLYTGPVFTAASTGPLFST